MSVLALIDIVLGVIGIYFVKAFLTAKKTPAPLPPGPKPRLLIGNLTDLPPTGEQEWVHWTKHKDLYGPISSVSVFGQTLVIINDQRIAFDLLENRSNLHSSRPRMVFSSEMVGWGDGLAVLPYSDQLRIYRKNIHAVIGSKSTVSRFYNEISVEARRFLLRVLEEPEKLLQHIRTEAGAVILKISHGYTIEPRGRDPLVDLAEEAMLLFSLSAVPGAWLVDTIPLLKYLPSWLPGMSFKRTAAKWRKTVMDFVEKPHSFVKNQMASGNYMHSYTSALLEKGQVTPKEEHYLKWSSMSLYAGGSDTTVSSMSIFFLVMMLYPEVQRKAQEEIDRVIGDDRLPEFDDRQRLPYVDAVMKEVLRWHPIAPLSVPHTSVKDDIYEGYFVPKGSVLIPNIWYFTHDPNAYHDPMEFKPERFLGIDGKEPEMDPRNLVFGFGRRVCPGRELADASVYLSIAQSLAVFDVSKPIENGKVVEPTVAFSPGIISHPAPFKADVKPRSAKAELLIRAIEEEYPFTASDAKAILDLMT